MAIDTNKAARFMVNNYLETGYANLQLSSQNLDYSFADALDPKQRSKVFKFGGRFLIEADVNDKLYISGTTYTVAADDYNTAQDLVDAINDVIAGVAEIVHSQSSADFVLVASGAARTFELSNDVEAIWETIGFTSGADIVDAAVGFENRGDQVRIHWPYEEITIDFGYQAPIGFVGIISDLASEFSIHPGAEIRILGNTVDSFVAPPLDQVIPIYDTGAFKFIDDISDSSWRYVKLRITCPTATQVPEFGYLYIGDYGTIPERNVSTGVDVAHEDNSIISMADNGQVYGADKTPLRVYSSLEVGLARPAAVAYLKNIYKLKQLSTPFFFCLDPKNFLGDGISEHLALVRFTSPPKNKHILNNLWQIGFELKEVI